MKSRASVLNNCNTVIEEITARTQARNKICYAAQYLLKLKILTQHLKVAIGPAVPIGSQTQNTTKQDEK